MESRHRTSRLKRILVLTLSASILLAISVVLSILAAQWVMQVQADGKQHESGQGHDWLHEQLNLTDTESNAVDALESDYLPQRNALRENFDAQIVQLRALLVERDSYSADVDRAIHRLHEVHGALQELAIRHYYDMMDLLPPDKQAKLRELAVKALSQPE